MCRQLWDEARHAMMGSVYFEAHGIDWKTAIPLHPGFALRLNQHMTALEAHAVLYTIEQSLMPAKTGKRYEWETAIVCGRRLAILFQDFDWADEVLHAQIGRRWLLGAHGLTPRRGDQVGPAESDRVRTGISHLYRPGRAGQLVAGFCAGSARDIKPPCRRMS